MEAMRHMVLQPQLSHRTLAEVGSVQNLQHIYQHDVLPWDCTQHTERIAQYKCRSARRCQVCSCIRCGTSVNQYSSTAHDNRTAVLNVKQWFAHTHTQAQTVYSMTTIMLVECWSTLSKAHMQLLLVHIAVQHTLIPKCRNRQLFFPAQVMQCLFLF